MKISRKQNLDNAKWINYYVDPETQSEVAEDFEGADILKVAIKYLRLKDSNAMQEGVYDIQVETKKSKDATSKSKFKVDAYIKKKLANSISDWENVLDEDGTKLAITPDNMDFLPAWLALDLVEQIDSLNTLNKESESD